MNIYKRCAALFAAPGGATFVSRLHRKIHEEKQAQKAELQDWENEGGTLAPSVGASDWRVTTDSAWRLSSVHGSNSPNRTESMERAP